MTFLSVVSLAALLMVKRSLDRWRLWRRGCLTIRIPPTKDDGVDSIAASVVE